MIFRTREELDHAVVTLHNDGLSKRALTKKFKMSRNTIRKIINKNQKNRDQGHCVPWMKVKSREKANLTLTYQGSKNFWIGILKLPDKGCLKN